MLYCAHLILFIHYVSDVLAIPKYDLTLSGKLSFPKEAIDKLRNEISLSSSDKKSVNDIISPKNMDLTVKQIRAMRNSNKKSIKYYVHHLVSKGGNRLAAEAKYFKRELQSKKDIYNLILVASKNYSSALQNYSEKLLLEVDPIYDLDKSLIVLDLIETATQLLHGECKIILNDILIPSLNTVYKAYQAKVIDLLETLYKHIVEDKQEEMEYICQHLGICRMFPAFSDYISDFIREILKLSDVRLNYFFVNTKLLIKEQANFFKGFLSVKLASILGDNLEALFNGDMVKFRHNLILFREILTQRHKLTRSKDNEIIGRSKSATILIDIIDKAFDHGDDEILSIHFDNTIKALKNWADMKNHDITTVLGSFVRYFANSLKYYWKDVTKEEVKVLVEIILLGNTTNENVYEYLFTKGSAYVNTKPEFDPNISI